MRRNYFNMLVCNGHPQIQINVIMVFNKAVRLTKFKEIIYSINENYFQL